MSFSSHFGLIILMIMIVLHRNPVQSYCPLLTPPRNGRLKGSCSSVLPNGSCFITCDPGYKLSGPSFLTCIDKKGGTVSPSWSTAVSGSVYGLRREEREKNFPTDPNADNRWRSSYRTEYNPPYQQSYQSWPYRYNPTHAPYQTLPAPSYGQPQSAPSYRSGDTWSTDHVWDNSVPTCDAIFCPSVSPPKNGGSTGACDPGLGTRICSFYCHQGYQLSGPSGIVCLPGGNWNKDPPTCVKDTNRDISCPNLIYRWRNGGVFLGACAPGKPGQKCTLDCAEKYRISGDRDGVFTCQDNGMWDKPLGTTQCIQMQI